MSKLIMVTDKATGRRVEARERVPCSKCGKYARWSGRIGMYLCKRCGTGIIKFESSQQEEASHGG